MAGMSILEEIVRRKREEVAARRASTPATELLAHAKDAPPPRDFLAALRDRPNVAIIAEIKRASPAAGAIWEGADILAIAHAYAEHGAACVSVLTDGPFFGGSLLDLRAVRGAIALPCLRKDFLIDAYQLPEARAAGADAVLLIAEILDDARLRGFREEAEALGMAALVECYNEANVERVVRSGATLIGVNNRNLHTFETQLKQTLDLAPRVPADRLLVSESGIRVRQQVEQLAEAGVHAILVGESLMRSGDLAGSLAELAHVAKQQARRA